MTGFPAAPESDRPPRLSATLALAAAIGASLVASTDPLGTALVILTTLGLALFSVGTGCSRRGHEGVGRILSILGVAVALLSFVGSIGLSLPLPVLLPALSCGIGLVVLALGLYTLSGSTARGIAFGGLTMVFLGVIANAIVTEGPIWQPAVPVALIVVAWDVSDRSIGLGQQVGMDAETSRVELMGAVTSGAIAIVGIGLAVIAVRLPIQSPSIVGLAFLLVSAVVFVLALSHVPDDSGTNR